MTYSVKQQLRRVRKLRREMQPARSLTFCLEDGSEISDEQRAQIRPADSVVIRIYPVGFLKRV